MEEEEEEEEQEGECFGRWTRGELTWVAWSWQPLVGDSLVGVGVTVSLWMSWVISFVEPPHKDSSSRRCGYSGIWRLCSRVCRG